MSFYVGYGASHASQIIFLWGAFYLGPQFTHFCHRAFIFWPAMVVSHLFLNTKGLNSPFKRSMLWKEANSCKADIVCTQETHIKASAPVIIHQHSFQHLFMACSDKAIRVIFHLHQSIGRYIIAICDINNVTCTLVTIYVPNTHQVAFLNKLGKKIKRVKQGNLLWCGDFNVINEASMDSTSRSKRPLYNSILGFTIQIYTTAGDVIMPPKKITHSTLQSFSRIDRLLVEKQLLQHIQKCTKGTITWSHHVR